MAITESESSETYKLTAPSVSLLASVLPLALLVRFRAPFHLPSLQACVSQELLPASHFYWSQRPLQPSPALCAGMSVFPKDMSILPHLNQIYQTALAAAWMQLVPAYLPPQNYPACPCPLPFPLKPCPQTQRLSHPCLTRAPACCPYLHGQLLTTGHVKESRSVVILIQHSDIDGSCGTAGWCSPILHNHQELVAGLLLPVQAMLGAELPCEGEAGTQLSPKTALEKSLCSGMLLGSPAPQG